MNLCWCDCDCCSVAILANHSHNMQTLAYKSHEMCNCWPQKNTFAKWKVCVAKNSNLKYGFKNLTRKVHMFNYCTKTKKQGQSKVQNDLSMKS